MTTPIQEAQPRLSTRGDVSGNLIHHDSRTALSTAFGPLTEPDQQKQDAIYLASEAPQALMSQNKHDSSS